MDRRVTDIKGYEELEQLALDLRTTWNHKADAIWRKLDSELWGLTHNPWAILQTTSREKLVAALEDSEFKQLLSDLVKSRQEELKSSTWFSKNHPNTSLKAIAYFSMEFMLSEALPIYSGGLGNVAGDQLKAASDLGVPVVGVSLLYSQGYFRQFITKEGEQQEIYPYNDPGQLPIRPTRLPNGEWLRLKVELPGWSLFIRVWEVRVGRTLLYLLDSNDVANFPAHRGITSELYGGDSELRLKQELVLGIGGWRLLETLGIDPHICHLNEGHAAFAILERAASFMKKTGQPFEVALAATRVGNLFTTHTAVPAGFDRFSPDLITRYLEAYAKNFLDITIIQLLSLGQIQPHDPFNMAHLALRGSGFVNGVSQLHGAVSRQLFQIVFPRYPQGEVPVGYVTNGVHTPSWDSAEADALWTEACGKLRWVGETGELEKKIKALPDAQIWEMRTRCRTHLVHYSRARFVRQLQARGGSEEEIEHSKSFLNPDVLTLGFARRFAAYKRPDLLLADEKRLTRILTNWDRPVQLIIAGKAHPADREGHALIKRWIQFVKNPEVRSHVIFLSDYDMNLTEHLVQGVDLWINTPRRPWEASGTSGMKILVNGGLNLSELDGWWVEAYTPEVGWALGDLKDRGEDPSWDLAEAKQLYDLLENDVAPLFYTRNSQNIPCGWIEKIRESMSRLTPQFSSNRAVREYTEKFYIPAAASYQQRIDNKGALAREIAVWKQSIEHHWDQLKFGTVKVNGTMFEVQVFLNNLDRHAIKVELFSVHGTIEMTHSGEIANTRNGHLYRAEVPSVYPPAHYTPRIVPFFPGVSIPLEAPHILWQR